MMISGLDQGRTRLRESRVFLNILLGASLIVGVALWSISPSLSRRPAFRLISLGATSFLGLLGLVGSGHLQSLESLLFKVEKVENEINAAFLAAQQEMQIGSIEQEVDAAAEPHQLPNFQSELPGGSAPEVAPEATPEVVGVAQLKSIKAALTEGKSDTFIVEEVLGYRGRSFATGKAILGRIKEVL